MNYMKRLITYLIFTFLLLLLIFFAIKKKPQMHVKINQQPLAAMDNSPFSKEEKKSSIVKKPKILASKKPQPQNPYLINFPLSSRPNKIAGEQSNTLSTHIPAPKGTVLAEHLQWEEDTLQSCDSACKALYSADSTDCKQLNAISKKDKLCVIAVLNKYKQKQIHQIVLDQNNIPQEDVLFEQNRPVALARYQKGELVELFTQWSLQDLHFFRLLKPIQTDWTEEKGQPSPYYTDISIQIYPTKNTWIPIYYYDEKIDGFNGNFKQTQNEYVFETHFEGFNPSLRFIDTLFQGSLVQYM